jgi:hypothetical protein
MINIERLMEMNKEEIDMEWCKLENEYFEKIDQKCDMEICYDLKDDDIFELYISILEDIDLIEKNIRVIEDYQDNYDYYWDNLE